MEFIKRIFGETEYMNYFVYRYPNRRWEIQFEKDTINNPLDFFQFLLKHFLNRGVYSSYA